MAVVSLRSYNQSFEGVCLRLSRLIPLAFCACTATMHAQRNDLAAILERLGAQAARLEHSLPSFSCTETAVSQEIRPNKNPQKEQVVRRVSYTATLRVRRLPDGTLSESPDYSIVDDKPFRGGGFVLPAYAEGGFRHALGFFLPADQRCYRYSLTADATRINFAASPGAAADRSCRSSGVTGFATLDAQGELVHIERRATGPAAEAHGLIPFASIDLAPVALGGSEFQLSSHLLSERRNGRFVDRFEASYTNCKLFTATVTIGPAEEVAPELPPHP